MCKNQFAKQRQWFRCDTEHGRGPLGLYHSDHRRDAEDSYQPFEVEAGM